MYVEGEAASYRWVETVTEWEGIRVVGETDRDAKRTKTATRAMRVGVGEGGWGCVIRTSCFFYLKMLF